MARITKTKFLTMAGLLALLCALASPPSRADGAGFLTIANLTATIGNAGNTITVFGDLTNTSSSQLDFNNDNPNFTNLSVSSSTGLLTLNGILGFGPADITGNTKLTGVELFTFIIAPGAAPGVYTLNNYTVYGGTNTGCAIGDCASQLGIIDFTVTVKSPVTTPEPGSLVLLVSGLIAGLLALRRGAR